MRGSDLQRPARWSVTNAAGLASWLHLPLTSGWADGGRPTIRLVLNASGVREMPAPFTEQLVINVGASAIRGDSTEMLSALAAVATTVLIVA